MKKLEQRINEFFCRLIFGEHRMVSVFIAADYPVRSKLTTYCIHCHHTTYKD